MQKISREQARRFLLAKNGLLGAPKFRGEAGVLAYVRQAGCVQADPIDVCGKSHELALLSRVKGFTKEMLDGLLYEQRALIDFFEKSRCLLCVEDWPALGFVRSAYASRMRLMEESVQPILHLIREQGSISAADAPRSALEALYLRGELVLEREQNGIKRYALAADHIPPEILHAPSPFRNPQERQMWQVMRRIGAVGMLWDAPSDAWLGVAGLTAQARKEVFGALWRLGVILPVWVEDLSLPLWLLAEDAQLLSACSQPIAREKQAHLLAPLDAMLWDRKLISAVFGFHHKWEICMPEEQRRYGYYVLPVVWGEGFAGRIEPVCDRERDALVVRHFWPEEGQHLPDRCLWEIEDALDGLRRFHGLKKVCWQ